MIHKSWKKKLKGYSIYFIYKKKKINRKDDNFNKHETKKNKRFLF